MFHRSSFQFLCGAVCLLVLAVLGLPLEAHQIPSLSVEALFSKDRTYLVRINVDPRLFLSAQPSSLPPVPVEWFRDQSDAEKKKTFETAEAYLKKALQLKFGTELVPLPPSVFQPMDGATNQPMVESTQEAHLLAETRGKAPVGATTFEALLSQDAGVSMILLSSFEGEMEKRPNVVFPGESSRPFPLRFVAETPSAPVISPVEPESRSSGFPLLALGLGALLLVLLVVGFLTRRSRRGSL